MSNQPSSARRRRIAEIDALLLDALVQRFALQAIEDRESGQSDEPSADSWRAAVLGRARMFHPTYGPQLALVMAEILRHPPPSS